MENTTPRHIPTTTVTQPPPDTEGEQHSLHSPPPLQHSTSSSISSSNPCSSETPSQSASQSPVVDSEPTPSAKSMDVGHNKRLSRPKLGSRKSSGSIIIPRTSSAIAPNEQYDPDDARAMSPRRTSDEIDRMGDDARQALEEQAHALQSNLLEILERVDSVKSEHEKLEGGNKFLQSYIGELMQTSKITAAGAPKAKKGRGNK